jgi:hypothetical protein
MRSKTSKNTSTDGRESVLTGAEVKEEPNKKKDMMYRKELREPQWREIPKTQGS